MDADDRAAALPHANVRVRLGVSPIHGIGVFAIGPIARGTNLFPNDRAPIRWVDAALVDALPPASPERRLYVDFGIRRGDRIGCPTSFDLLTVGWYCNEPEADDEATVIATPDCDLVAARDVEAGEELTVRYADFSDPPSPTSRD